MTLGISYEYERDDYYCYPDSGVLRNKLNITDAEALEQAERDITSLKQSALAEKPLAGELNFDYLRAIHRFIFCDVYEWAGEIRKVDISKGNVFCMHEYIKANAEALMDELKSEEYLVEAPEEDLPRRLAYYLSELNTIHPFREGNGRSQREFIRVLAKRAGYELDFGGITAEEMIKASDRAFRREYDDMEKLVARALRPAV